jgi:hypothetical protein
MGTTNKSEAMTGFVVKWGDNVYVHELVARSAHMRELLPVPAP